MNKKLTYRDFEESKPNDLRKFYGLSNHELEQQMILISKNACAIDYCQRSMETHDESKHSILQYCGTERRFSGR